MPCSTSTRAAKRPMPAGRPDREARSERPTLVVAVDLRGIGETQAKGGWGGDLFGPDTKDVLTAYLLGRSYVGMRAEDILVCARLLQGTVGAARRRGRRGQCVRACPARGGAGTAAFRLGPAGARIDVVGERDRIGPVPQSTCEYGARGAGRVRPARPRTNSRGSA